MCQRPKHTARTDANLAAIFQLAKTQPSLKTVLTLVKGAQSWTPQGVERQKAESLARAPRATLACRLLQPLIGSRSSSEAYKMLDTLFFIGPFFFLFVFMWGLMSGIGLYVNGSIPMLAITALAGTATGIGALGLAFSCRYLAGYVSIDLTGPAVWKTCRCEAHKETPLHGNTLHPHAHSLISDIAELLPGSAFEVDSLTQDGSVSHRFLRVRWASPAGARESEIVLGWNGHRILEPS